MSEQREVVRIFIPGRARTKGSLKVIHIRGRAGAKCNAYLTEDHSTSKPWMRDMIVALKRERDGSVPCAEPVEVHLFFKFQRGAETTSPRRSGNQIWPSHDTDWPTAVDIGDEDKLRRNVLDALTQSGVLADDRLSVGGMNYKRWCVAGEQPGVQIVVLTAPSPDSVELMEKVLDARWSA
jgi:Holliday junction resolvase RusA-like endonuclease